MKKAIALAIFIATSSIASEDLTTYELVKPFAVGSYQYEDLMLMNDEELRTVITVIKNYVKAMKELGRVDVDNIVKHKKVHNMAVRLLRNKKK